MPTETTTPNETAIAILAWRTKHDLTLEQAARKLGVTTSSLHRWEHCNKIPGAMARKILVQAGVIPNE